MEVSGRTRATLSSVRIQPLLYPGASSAWPLSQHGDGEEYNWISEDGDGSRVFERPMNRHRQRTPDVENIKYCFNGELISVFQFNKRYTETRESICQNESRKSEKNVWEQ